MAKPAVGIWHRLGDKQPPEHEVVPIAPAEAPGKVWCFLYQDRTWFDAPYSLPAHDDDLWCELEPPR